nr:chaperone protein DnaJ 49 [Ipomoea batatas]
MECNRDEAIRAKTIAEKKLEQKDFAGAKKFVLKAQTLYPGLEDLSQMLTILDVYISAENKIGGEVDWYGVLGVSPSADDDTLRKQYRKLALILHPDKNKAIGADGAFKLLSEAWSFLSDKSKRLMYNQRRSSKGFQQKAPVHSSGPSAPARANGFHNVSGRATSSSKSISGGARAPSTSVRPPSNPRNDTFWTICQRCMMHYEYLKVYLNHTLLCPNCHEAFLAREIPPPFNKTSNSVPRPRQQNSGNHAANGNQSHPGRNVASNKSSGPSMGGLNSANYTNLQQDPFSGMARFGSTDPSIAAKATNIVHQAHERMKRGRDDLQSATGWDRAHAHSSVMKNEIPFKKMRLGEDINRYSSNPVHYADKGYASSGRYGRPNSTREFTALEINKMLMEKAKKEILNKLNEWKSETVHKALDTEKEKVKEKKKEKERNNKVSGLGMSGKSNSSALRNVESLNTSADDVNKEDPAVAAMSVPDPDFHNFDLDRTEGSFQENEVWAAYDDDDGMPRFYALIHKVMSVKPFKLRLSWLNSKTNTEFGPMEWVTSGFYKTCGEFRVGRYEMSKSINSFSQKVKWSKGPRGTIHIFPKKGDVWALYRDWSPDWSEHTPDEVIHKYDMVVVLDDYDEGEGVSVAPLVKVSGFKTVFRPHLDPEKVKPIPKEEMFRFSHQVPSHLLTGEEAQNSPKGYLELDPAATPLELLQIITDAKEVPTMQNGGDMMGNIPQRSPGTMTDEIAEVAFSPREEKFVQNSEEDSIKKDKMVFPEVMKEVEI